MVIGFSNEALLHECKWFVLFYIPIKFYMLVVYYFEHKKPIVWFYYLFQ